MSRTLVHVNGWTTPISKILTLLYENDYLDWPTVNQEKPEVWGKREWVDCIEAWKQFEENLDLKNKYPSGQYDFDIMIPDELIEEVLLIKLCGLR